MTDKSEASFRRKARSVFTLNPRTEDQDVKLWMQRQKEERELRLAILDPQAHVILNGPSGSGKTSLALSVLNKLRRSGVRYTYHKVGKTKLNWEDIKHGIFSASYEGAQTESGYKIGIKNLIPYVEFSEKTENLELRGERLRKYTDRLSVSDIAEILSKEKLCLVVDDIEIDISGKVIDYLTDLAKEISTTISTPHVKLVMIGSDDTAEKIMESGPQLEERIHIVTIASISPSEAWKFLCLGLERVGLRNPAIYPSSTTKEQYSRELSEAKEMSYFAANGLPKSLVDLGYKIAIYSASGNVSTAGIKKVALEKFENNWKISEASAKRLIKLAKSDAAVASVLAYIFNNGASCLFSLTNISTAFSGQVSESFILAKLEILVKAGLLVRTGENRDTFFSKKPLVLHSISVTNRNPEKVGLDINKYGRQFVQHSLDFHHA